MKYLTVFWKSQDPTDYDKIFSVFAANRGKVDLVFEGKCAAIYSYSDNCLDQLQDNYFRQLDAWVYTDLDELLEEQGAKDLDDLIASFQKHHG